MKIKIICLLSLLFFIACKEESKNASKLKEHIPYVDRFENYDDAAEIAEQQDHEKDRMRFKLLNSKVLDRASVWEPLMSDLASFSEEGHNRLKPLVLEQDIPTIQEHIKEGKLSYEQLTLFYLYRINKYESDPATSLYAIIAMNPEAVAQARAMDKKGIDPSKPLFGMPILLKDNIGTSEMPTTAGALALKDNQTKDAFIVERLKDAGAIILGKVNLSEWAYYFCSGCPLGYSAIGGQSLNPYGRKIFETGGSSAASGTSIAANYAVAAIGTETAGSILSPSSQNSVVGLKPTIGLLSRSGIVPISSTLDTPGPMTKSVVDNAIVLEALLGFDKNDTKSIKLDSYGPYVPDRSGANLKGKRFGAFKNLIESDSIYRMTMQKLKDEGAEIIQFEPPQASLDGFLTLLNIDMKHDLPAYLETYASDNIVVKTVADVVNFNKQDTLVRAPYGQALFEGIVADSTTVEELQEIKKKLMANGKTIFDEVMKENDLDAVLSINNYHAAFAAVAEYPCLTVPMGYKETGEPISLTFIGKPLTEKELYELGYAFEQATKIRQIPREYQ
ncbi:amidase family protein [Sungkyunkwania multivorans]|uniref:Amidase family protein n=1 Tax=Sungkyunkwania multivorans TaxID=1173618 RepID=A0ABW3D296_9FLAO